MFVDKNSCKNCPQLKFVSYGETNFGNNCSTMSHVLVALFGM